MKTIKKSALKENYYWECNPWYDKCPDELPAVEFQTEIFPKAMTHEEILETYKIVPYVSYEQACAVVASIIPTLKNDYKWKIVYFKENDILYRFYVYRYDGGRLYVYVLEVSLDFEFDPGDGVSFSTTHIPLETSETLTPKPSDTSLENAIKVVKSAGYIIYKEI